MNKMMSENVGALANALGKAPKCGEPGDVRTGREKRRRGGEEREIKF